MPLIPRTCVRLLAVAFLLAALALPAAAAEVDKYLPNDTESVQAFNLRQFLDSEIIKKHALKKIEEGIRSVGEAQKVLKELGFDPLQDLDSYTQTNGGGDKIDNALYIFHGKFDPAKLHAKAAKLAEDMPMLLKVSKVDANQLYEFISPFPLPPPLTSVYIALVDEKTLVASLSKDYILEVFDKKAGKKKTVLRKEVRELIEKTDGKQTFWIAAFRAAFLKGPIKEQAELKPFADFLEMTEHLSGGLTVTAEVKAQFTLVVKDAAAAKAIVKQIEDSLADARNGVIGDALQKATFEVFLGGIKVAANDKVVTLTSHASKQAVEKLVELIK